MFIHSSPQTNLTPTADLCVYRLRFHWITTICSTIFYTRYWPALSLRKIFFSVWQYFIGMSSCPTWLRRGSPSSPTLLLPDTPSSVGSMDVYAMYSRVIFVSWVKEERRRRRVFGVTSTVSSSWSFSPPSAMQWVPVLRVPGGSMDSRTCIIYYQRGAQLGGSAFVYSVHCRWKYETARETLTGHRGFICRG